MLLKNISVSQKTPLKSDMSGRKYSRIIDIDQNNYILMESFPDHHEKSIPGHKISDYVLIGDALLKAGLSVPKVYDYNSGEGYMLLEDFGDIMFSDQINRGENLEHLYGLATDALEKISSSSELSNLNIKKYYDGHVHENKKFVMEFYLPYITGHKTSLELVDRYKSIWQDIENKCPPCPLTFQHIDFSAGNLMLLPEREDVNECGIIDFQGGMIGPYVYDLVNLLEDARLDVPEEIRISMKEKFCKNMDDNEKELFNSWYSILSAQFHLRLIGQFIRIATVMGNDSYIEHLPRIASYIRNELQDPLLEPLKDFFDEIGVDFEYTPTKEVVNAGISSAPHDSKLQICP